MNKLTIEVNGKYLSWNEVIKIQSQHWSKKGNAFNTWKEVVFWEAQKVKRKSNLVFPFTNKVDIKITGYKKENRIVDSDGICEKPLIDALKLAGIIVDDNIKYVGVVSKEAVTGVEKDYVSIVILY